MEKMRDDIRSAGAWFVCEYSSPILDNYQALVHDKVFKTEFVKHVFREAKRDSHIGGTRTRVNAVLRIIDRHELADALIYVIHSDRVGFDEPDAIEKAKILYMKISVH